MKKLDSAMSLSVQGFRLFPCTPNSKIPMKGWTDWETRATDDPDEITRIWSQTPNANLGLATGPSGLVVLDFDAAKSPEEVSGIEAFRAVYPRTKLPATYTVRTGSGGWHLYYRAHDVPLRNSASRLAQRVDTRAQGGYVLAPGSSIDGNNYVVTSKGPLANLPEWLTEALTDKLPTTHKAEPKGDSTAYALAALRRECEDIRNTNEGGRNHAVNRAAWNVSRFVVKGELDENVAYNDLVAAALDCGLEVRELQNAIKSGMTRGKAHYGD